MRLRFPFPALHFVNPVARERLIAFSRFLWHRFVDDKCFEAAGALSYTTVFALVPLAVATLGIMGAFPQFGAWSEQLTDFIFSNFVPSTGRAVQGYLVEVARNAAQLTGAGLIALLVSALVLMHSVEETFNKIWRAPTRRRRVTRLIIYWTVVTLGPVVIAASLSLSAEWFGNTRARSWLADWGSYLLPVAVTWAGFCGLYMVVPNGPVRFRNAVIGSSLATLLFELAKLGFAWFLASANYTKLYGALSAVPVLLIWVYVSWVIVLLGASLCARLTAFRVQPTALRVPVGLEFAALLRTMRLIASHARRGAPVTRDQLATMQPGLTDEQIDRFLEELRSARLTQRTEGGTIVPLRDPAQATLRELFEAGRYRWPTQVELHRFARSATPAERVLVEWFESCDSPLHAALNVPLAKMIEDAPVPVAPVAGEA
jgi:membrane protein